MIINLISDIETGRLLIFLGFRYYFTGFLPKSKNIDINKRWQFK